VVVKVRGQAAGVVVAGGGAPRTGGGGPPGTVAAEVSWKDRVAHGRTSVRRADGELRAFWIFAEGRSRDDEPDSEASGMWRLLDYVFTPFRYICRSN